MSKARKIWLIIGGCLIIAGSAVFAGAMAVLNFDFAALSTQKYETNAYEVSGDFDKISIDVTTPEIVFAPSDNENCRVECIEQKKLRHTVYVQDGTLKIDTVDNRKWYDYIGISFTDEKITVYLPENEYISLFVETNTGDVEIPDGFTFEKLDISGDTADIVCNAAVKNSTEISTDTGSIEIGSANAGKLKLSTATGSIELTNVACESLDAESNTGNILIENVIAADSFSIESDTGNVRFESSDAENISVKTSTGNVTGTLLSEKVFETKTSTGNVNVPKVATGGRCEIKTSTGNIKISIQGK